MVGQIIPKYGKFSRQAPRPPALIPITWWDRESAREDLDQRRKSRGKTTYNIRSLGNTLRQASFQSLTLPAFRTVFSGVGAPNGRVVVEIFDGRSHSGACIRVVNSFEKMGCQGLESGDDGEGARGYLWGF